MRAPSSSRIELETRRRDELQHVVGGVHPLLGGLLLQDRDARFQVGRLDVGEQAPLEAGAHAVFQGGQLARRAVRADHDLLVGVVQRVEGVEELFLGALAVLQELDVVDQQDVDVAVAPLEGLRLVVAQAVDEVVGEFLGRDVTDRAGVPEGGRVVADRVQQVRLAEPGAAVDEQRVVGLGRRLGDGDRGGVREAVGRADDERLEHVLRVEPVAVVGAARVAARADVHRRAAGAVVAAAHLQRVVAAVLADQGRRSSGRRWLSRSWVGSVAIRCIGDSLVPCSGACSGRASHRRAGAAAEVGRWGGDMRRRRHRCLRHRLGEQGFLATAGRGHAPGVRRRRRRPLGGAVRVRSPLA